MVYKKSEYQNQYKASVIKKNQAVYLQNLNLRYERRDREFMHTPLTWGDLSEEEEITSTDSNEEALSKTAQNKKLSESEKFQSLAEILTESKLKLEAYKKSKHTDGKLLDSLDIREAAADNERITPNSIDSLTYQKETQTEPSKISKIQQSNESHKYSDESQITDNIQINNDMQNCPFNLRPKSYSRCKHSHANVNKNKFAHAKNGKSRPDNFMTNNNPVIDLSREIKVPPLFTSTSNSARHPRPKSSKKSVSKSMSRPPFISYGAGDIEDSVSVRRTYNVRALADVYPTALKAKLRREQDLKKQREKIAVSHSPEALLEKLSSARCQDSCSWESEYSKQFHGYEPKDYERALSARAVIPRSTPIPGVHRQGCLVVHVD